MCIPARLQRRCTGTLRCMMQRVHLYFGHLAVEGVLIKWSKKGHKFSQQMFASSIC